MRRSVSRNRIRRARRRKPTVSGLEKRVQAWLVEADIAFLAQYAIGRCHVDLFVEPLKVIEIAGCYWHNCQTCCPKITKHNKGIQRKDRKRYLFLISQGYELLILWEHELTEANKHAVLRKIRS